MEICNILLNGFHPYPARSSDKTNVENEDGSIVRCGSLQEAQRGFDLVVDANVHTRIAEE